MLKRKPIICAKNSNDSKIFSYNNCFVGWALDIPIEFLTDLTYKQFCKFLDVGFTSQQIEKFEMTGRF